MHECTRHSFVYIYTRIRRGEGGGAARQREWEETEGGWAGARRGRRGPKGLTRALKIENSKWPIFPADGTETKSRPAFIMTCIAVRAAVICTVSLRSATWGIGKRDGDGRRARSCMFYIYIRVPYRTTVNVAAEEYWYRGTFWYSIRKRFSQYDLEHCVFRFDFTFLHTQFKRISHLLCRKIERKIPTILLIFNIWYISLIYNKKYVIFTGLLLYSGHFNTYHYLFLRIYTYAHTYGYDVRIIRSNLLLSSAFEYTRNYYVMNAFTCPNDCDRNYV